MEDIYLLWSQKKLTIQEVYNAVWERISTTNDDPEELGLVLAKILTEYREQNDGN